MTGLCYVHADKVKLEILHDPQTPVLFIRGARALRRTALRLHQGQIIIQDLAKLHEGI